MNDRMRALHSKAMCPWAGFLVYCENQNKTRYIKSIQHIVPGTWQELQKSPSPIWPTLSTLLHKHNGCSHIPGKHCLRTLESISNKGEWKKWNHSLGPRSNNQPSDRSVWEAHPHNFSQKRHFIPAPNGVETTPVFPRHHALFPRTPNQRQGENHCH